MQAGDSFSRPNARAFHKNLKGKNGLFHRHAKIAEWIRLDTWEMRFGVCLFTRSANGTDEAIAMATEGAAVHLNGFGAPPHVSIMRQAHAVGK
jgi:hypothetical protein